MKEELKKSFKILYESFLCAISILLLVGIIFGISYLSTEYSYWFLLLYPVFIYILILLTNLLMGERI